MLADTCYISQLAGGLGIHSAGTEKKVYSAIGWMPCQHWLHPVSWQNCWVAVSWLIFPLTVPGTVRSNALVLPITLINLLLLFGYISFLFTYIVLLSLDYIQPFAITFPWLTALWIFLMPVFIPHPWSLYDSAAAGFTLFTFLWQIIFYDGASNPHSYETHFSVSFKQLYVQHIDRVVVDTLC